MITRRLFSFGLLAAPAIIRTPGLLMAVRPERMVYASDFVTVTLGSLALAPGALTIVDASYLGVGPFTVKAAEAWLNAEMQKSLLQMIQPSWTDNQIAEVLGSGFTLMQ